MNKVAPILIILSFLLILQCGSIEHKSENRGIPFKPQNAFKINGVSFVSPPNEFKPELLKIPSQKIGANWVCFMPFGFIQKDSNQVQFNSKWQWWGEKKDGISSMIKMAHEQEYEIMIKPQIWIRHGEFTGHHKYANESDWKAFERSYSEFILTYAKLADSLNIELFCIGTELEQFVLNRPEYWKKLIQEVKKIYRGRLTYAANWDEYIRVPFWNQLDYIGIDSYFPLSKSKTPTVAELRKGWKPHGKIIKHFTDSTKRSILFTEFGYRSRDYSANKPWEADHGGNVNHEAQNNAYEAMFEELWQEDYFAGGFLWKWFPDYDKAGGFENSSFTPQRKPVEHTIKKYYTTN